MTQSNNEEIKLKVETNIYLSPEDIKTETKSIVKTSSSNDTISILVKNTPEKSIIKYLPYAGIVLSIFSLGLTLFIESHNQKQREISVMPLMNCKFDISQEDPYLEVENRGLGPAFVYPLHFYYNNEYLGTNSITDWKKTFDKIPTISPNTNIYRYHMGSIVKPKDIVKLIWLDTNATKAEKNALKDILPKLSIIVVCKNAYGNIFIDPLLSVNANQKFMKNEFKRIGHIYETISPDPFTFLK